MHVDVVDTELVDPLIQRILVIVSCAMQVFEVNPSLCVVELMKSQGDSSWYRKVLNLLFGSNSKLRDLQLPLQLLFSSTSLGFPFTDGLKVIRRVGCG